MARAQARQRRPEPPLQVARTNDQVAVPFPHPFYPSLVRCNFHIRTLVLNREKSDQPFKDIAKAILPRVTVHHTPRFVE
ncbi:MAG: hypothetical protein ACE5R6_11065 [Candidatus Heimdallarchaeota archaeon]